MDSSPKDLAPFVEANHIRLQNENAMMHINGMYIMDAILATVGNSGYFRAKGAPPNKYPEQPYDIFGKSEIEEDMEKQKELDEFVAREKARRANWRMMHPREEQ